MFFTGTKLVFTGEGKGHNRPTVLVYVGREQQIEFDMRGKYCTVVDDQGHSGQMQVRFEGLRQLITVAKDEGDFRLASGNEWLGASDSIVQLEQNCDERIAAFLGKAVGTPDPHPTLVFVKLGTYVHARLLLSENRGDGTEATAIHATVLLTQGNSWQWWITAQQAVDYLRAIGGDNGVAEVFARLCRDKGWIIPIDDAKQETDAVETFVTQWGRAAHDAQATDAQYWAIARAARERRLPWVNGAPPTLAQFVEMPTDELLAIKGVGPKTLDLIDRVRQNLAGAQTLPTEAEGADHDTHE